MSKLIDGLPDKNRDEINNEKEKYDLNSLKLSKFYKSMHNGITKVYLNIDCMNKNKENINEQIIIIMENFIFKFYFENLDLIIAKINDKKDIIDLKDKSNDQLYSTNINFVNKEKINIILKDLSRDKNLINNLYNKFINLADDYKIKIKSALEPIIEQKKEIFNYLNKKQDLFMEYLDRKINNIKEAEMYIKKYNTIIIKYESLKNNDIIYKELSNDINYIKNLLWNKIQTTKEENIKYLKKK